MIKFCFLTRKTVFVNADENIAILDTCDWKVEPLGCYDDQTWNRAIPLEIINERDPVNHNYNGILVNWKGFKYYLQEFICRCAKAAFSNGYNVIGVQFYGECWSGNSAYESFKKHGLSTKCVDNHFNECKKDGPVCTGTASTNYVYRIAPTSCDVAYEPIGCFKDNLNLPRPLPEYIMNERDYSHHGWNGHLINWKEWNTYSPGFLCRCAKAVKEKNYTIFAAQFYGECWSGKNPESTMKRDGPSDQCIAEDFDKCRYNSFHCVGKDHANYIYRLV